MPTESRVLLAAVAGDRNVAVDDCDGNETHCAMFLSWPLVLLFFVKCKGMGRFVPTHASSAKSRLTPHWQSDAESTQAARQAPFQAGMLCE